MSKDNVIMTKLRLRDTNWTAVHLGSKIVTPEDKHEYDGFDWNDILNFEVEPMETEGHYNVIDESF